VVFTHPPLDQCPGVPAGDLVIIGKAILVIWHDHHPDLNGL
jgi:hypothetical protein